MKNNIKAKLQEALELPAELLSDSYRVTVIDNTHIVVENYKSIVEYEEFLIRFSCGIVILGEKLDVLELTTSEISIEGIIKNIEFDT